MFAEYVLDWKMINMEHCINFHAIVKVLKDIFISNVFLNCLKIKVNKKKK